MSSLEKVGRFTICQSADRAPISFPRVPEEVVCLGFDPETEGLAELHVLSVGEDYNDRQRLSFIERAWNAASLTGPCFQQIIDVEEFQGMLLYATTINDGEFLSDYILRNGPLDRVLATALVTDLCGAVMQLQPHYRLLLGLNLSNLMVVVTEASLLTLRIVDLGLAKQEAGEMNDFQMSDIIEGVARAYYYMLAGKVWADGRTGQIAALKGTSAGVKVLLRGALNPSGGPAIESIDELYEGLCQIRNEIQPRRASRGHAGPLAAARTQHPRFLIQKTLFNRLKIEEVLGDGFEVDTDGYSGVYSFKATQISDQRSVLVQLLPPSSALPLEASSHVAAEMSLINAEQHPALIKPLGYMEEERAAFILEDATNGFSLPQLLTAREFHLEPAESEILLQQISEAMAQAEAAGLFPKNLTIHSVVLHFPSEPARRMRELMIRRVDHWPEHSIKLRCHPTIRSLISQAPSGRVETGRQRCPSPSDEARLAKGFLGIAENLFVGPWPPPPASSEEAESASLSDLRRFFRAAYQSLNEEAAIFNREVFISDLMQQPAVVEALEAEVSETITDGGVIHRADDAGDSVEFAETHGNSGLAEPDDGVTESLGTIDASDFDMPEELDASTLGKKNRFPW